MNCFEDDCDCDEDDDEFKLKRSGTNNPMYGKSIFQVWVEKYGVEIANEKEKIRIEKEALTKLKNKNK